MQTDQSKTKVTKDREKKTKAPCLDLEEIVHIELKQLMISVCLNKFQIFQTRNRKGS